MKIYEMSLRGGILICVIVLLRLLFFKHISKRHLMLLWYAAVAVLLLPFSLHSSFSIYGLSPSALSDGPYFEEGTYATGPDETVPGTSSVQSAEMTASVAQAPGRPSWEFIRKSISILLGLLCAVLYGFGFRRLSAGKPIDSPTAARIMRFHPTIRPVRILLSDKIATPLSGSILFPVIALPGGLATEDPELLSCILVHEMIHIRRFDALFKLLVCAALCLHWFNPAVWVIPWTAWFVRRSFYPTRSCVLIS